MCERSLLYCSFANEPHSIPLQADLSLTSSNRRIFANECHKWLIRAVWTMSDSDDDYVADDISDDDIEAHQVSTSHGTRSAGPVKGPDGSATRGGDTNNGSNRRRAAWEDIQRSWDTVVEGADGSINSTIDGLREAGKRKRHADSCSVTWSRLTLYATDYFETLLLYKGASSAI